MGRLPSEIWALTPADTDLLVRGWNEAQAAQRGDVQPMTLEQFDELKRAYPDE